LKASGYEIGGQSVLQVLRLRMRDNSAEPRWHSRSSPFDLAYGVPEKAKSTLMR
jgi:hypothetical protein